MDGAERPRRAREISLRLELAVYGAATFSNSLGYMIMVVVPLWVVTLHPSPLMIGVVLGSRHVLVLLYSIHGGAMMDRLDPRRVMVLFSGAGVLLPFLYPVLGVLWAVILLQMVAGYCSAIGWIGAQSLIGQAMKGSPVHAGRMSAVVRLGSLIGPPIAGAAWDFGGAWGGFGALSLWGVGLLASCLALPRTVAGAEARPRPRLADLIPRVSDYVAALSLLAAPLVAVIMGAALLRIAGFSIQASFYAVLLQAKGFTGTTIGVLLAIYSLFGGGTSLMVGPLLRRISAVWLMFVVVAGSVAAVTVTPALGSFAALAIASAVNGSCYGLSQPLVITPIARAAGPRHQGKAVGLRTTGNRLAATVMPVVMGAVVQTAGLAWAFYVTGGLVLILLAGVAFYARARHVADPPPASAA